MDILKRAETALSAEHRSEYDVHPLRLLIAELMDEVSKLRSIGKDLLDDQAAWITNGDHSGPTDPEQWELYVRARKIIEPGA